MSTRSCLFFLAHFFTRVVWSGSSTILWSVFKTFAVSLSGTDGRSIRVKKMRFQKYMHSCVRFINWRCGIFNQLKFISLHRSLSLLKKKFRIWLRKLRVLMHSIYFSINCKRFAKIIIINEWYLLSSLRFVTVQASNNTGNFNLTLK